MLASDEVLNRVADAVIAYYSEWASEGITSDAPGFFRTGLKHAIWSALRDPVEKRTIKPLGVEGTQDEV